MYSVIHNDHGYVMADYGDFCVVIHNGETQSFYGETCFQDAERYWFDKVVLLIHGGKYV